MFDSPADAAEALLAWFNQPQVEIVVEALAPAIIFTPTGDAPAPGGTRFGGAPDAPAGFVWPRPEAPANPEEIANRAHPDTAAEMRAHFAADMPFAFFAQIDLAEAARLGDIAATLPAEGRLLFFYDLATGPWDTGTRTAKVIWDRTPVEALQPAPIPDTLLDAAAPIKAESARLAAEYKLEPDDETAGTIYGGPPAAYAMKATYILPEPYALEISALPDIAAVARGETSEPEKVDVYDSYMAALEGIELAQDETIPLHQLLGPPRPEQDDPRYDAVIAAESGQQFISSEEWAARREEITRKAEDWALLLQVDIADWMRAQLTEGTVYFLIRKEDLAARRFDRVIAVYQQT